jgi:CHAT domain-containing protein
VGLENLARAWTLSGARAVVATQWPVKDSGNEFLARFYKRVYDDGPAEALRTAQAASIQSGAAPAVWASYQVYSNQLDEGIR